MVTCEICNKQMHLLSGHLKSHKITGEEYKKLCPFSEFSSTETKNKLSIATTAYDAEKNVVIEYYEKYHSRPTQNAKDIKRKEKLINHLRCNFIEIYYTNEIKITEYKECI